jgi:hypothetical protein
MLRAHVTQINFTDKHYQDRVHFFKSLNHSLAHFTDSELIFEHEGRKFNFILTFHEEDTFTKTFLSSFDDETPFRVIKPKGASRQVFLLKNNSKDAFSVGSLNPDGYAVFFILTEENDIRIINFQETGVEEQLQKLANGAIMAIQQELYNDFYNISRRLIAGLYSSNLDINELEHGTTIAQILKDNTSLYDENEQRIIEKM